VCWGCCLVQPSAVSSSFSASSSVLVWSRVPPLQDMQECTPCSTMQSCNNRHAAWPSMALHNNIRLILQVWMYQHMCTQVC
jgi:hypothetical protein